MNDYCDALENCELKHKLWKNFYDIICKIKGIKPDPIEEKLRKKQKIAKVYPSSKEIKVQAKEWLYLFRNCYFESDVTPYIHVFGNHLHTLYELHGNVNFYNQQGVEKLNNLITLSYFRCSNRKKDYLKQILLRFLQRDYLSRKLNISFEF